MKTVKEIADSLGVSKQSVFYQIKKIRASSENVEFVQKINGVYTVSFDEEKQILQAFDKDISPKEPPKETESNLMVSIQILHTENSYLKQQIEDYKKQVEFLTNAVIEKNNRGIFSIFRRKK